MSPRNANQYSSERYSDDQDAVQGTLDWQSHEDVQANHKDTYDVDTTPAQYRREMLESLNKAEARMQDYENVGTFGDPDRDEAKSLSFREQLAILHDPACLEAYAGALSMEWPRDSLPSWSNGDARGAAEELAV